ncbi:MAG: histidine phosphatase family protein [Pseudomonadota bacterium]
MSKLYLVRHGQASFLSDDYDRLSDQGIAQAKQVGDHWVARGTTITAAACGTLKRQRDTAAAVADVFSAAGQDFPPLSVDAGFNEYPADELMTHILPLLRREDARIDADAKAFETAEKPSDKYRYVHRLLEAVMAAWVEDRIDVADAGLPPWRTFSGGVRQALRSLLAEASSGSAVALFTSGGPIGIAVQTVLEAPEIKAAELNWRVHNASISEITFSRRRLSLDTFNTVEHLPVDMRTYR